MEIFEELRTLNVRPMFEEVKEEEKGREISQASNGKLATQRA